MFLKLVTANALFFSRGIVARARLYHVLQGTCDELPDPLLDAWFDKAFVKLKVLSRSLHGMDFFDGRVVNMGDGSVIEDELVKRKMNAFRSLVRAFVGSRSVQLSMKRSVAEFQGDGPVSLRHARFGEAIDRRPMVVDSLTKIGDILNISAQQRKAVRVAISPQVTQHRIWTGALDWILNDLKQELERSNRSHPNHTSKMGLQIVCSCCRFLDETVASYDEESASWMRLQPLNNNSSSKPPRTWADLLEMINDLTRCLQGRSEEGMAFHVNNLHAMKEGLSQIKDVPVDKNAGYKDLRHQESLVQRSLNKTLGHASPCLFALLCYYLYGSLRHLEVDLRGSFLRLDDGNKFCLYMGQILTGVEEDAVWNGIKRLEKVLRLFGFMWETAGMKGTLELQGHLWLVGNDSKVLAYKGNTFFIHGISL
ncbi:hypothetical protein MLD38_015226 [Melastoma candidum]|uniref:Uncharacterized protein n=1 Tax=Melastoma candidum TaxID=119954 RepID=A0ACB9RJ42_9MYRT|nr:hypothetical protein MLD38_015226 [Melastoma candidum]